MADLARTYPPAREAFLNVLDGLQAQVAGEGIPEFLLWQEWSGMCKYFDEQQRILAWYENHRDAEGTLFAAYAADRRKEFLVQLIVGEVAEALLEKNRPLDAARLFSDAYPYAEAAVTRFEEMRAVEARIGQKQSQEMRELSEEVSRRRLIKELVVVFTALLGAGRSEEAVEIGDLLLDTLDTPEARLALVSAGAAVAQGPEESLERWLNEAEMMGANVSELRDRLKSPAETNTDH